MSLTAVEPVLERDLSPRKFGLERDTIAGTFVLNTEMKRRRHCNSLETGMQVQEAAKKTRKDAAKDTRCHLSCHGRLALKLHNLLKVTSMSRQVKLWQQTT